MSSVLKPDEQDDGLEAAVDQAVAVCRRRYARGYSRAGRCEPFSGIEISESKKAVSHGYARGRFRTYTG